MTTFSTLKKYRDLPYNDDSVSYSFEEIKDKYDKIIPLGKDNYLVLKLPENKDSSLIEFVLFQFFSREIDMPKTMRVSCIFEGYGFGGRKGTLRECRHTYWYPDDNGYGYYMNGELIVGALSALKEYFDLD